MPDTRPTVELPGDVTGAILSLLPGDFAESLAMILNWLTAAQAAHPGLVDEQIAYVVGKITTYVTPKISAEGVAEGVRAIFTALTKVATGVPLPPPDPHAPIAQ